VAIARPYREHPTTSQTPCRLSFICDYFGLAVSGGNIYTLSVSTHYPSNVKADDGSTLHYQQQVLGTISRASLGI
jgi:hypothetical protein